MARETVNDISFDQSIFLIFVRVGAWVKPLPFRSARMVWVRFSQ